MGLAMSKILLLVVYKELIVNFVTELMSTWFKAHKRYFKFSAAARVVLFKELAKVLINN